MWLKASNQNQKAFTMVLGGLIAVTWLALSIWSLSPYAPFLTHEILEEVHFSVSAHYLGLMGVFVVGWVLMTIAMMLATSLPLVLLFRKMTRGRRNHPRLLLLLIGGYLAVWAGFGALAHFGDLFVHEAAEKFPWLESNAWIIGVGSVALAGLYQFTPLKYKCLDKCRSPMSFISQHWQGRHEQRRAFMLGVHHGLFCLGCCWSLMLLMFALACGNVVWMLVLGTVMAIEKNVTWGKRISAPLGGILLVAALVASGFYLFVQ